MAEINLAKPTIFNLKRGDVFYVSVQQTKNCSIPLDSDFIGAEKVRMYHVLRVFGRHFQIPYIKKTWVLTFVYHGEEKNTDV
jgi:hypothetical protein